LRYFRDSAPKHAADEEESLFPRMLTRAGSDATVISGLLDELNAEHRSLSERHEQVEELSLSWLAHNSLQALDVARLRSLLESMSESSSVLIAVEENDVFAWAVRILQTEDLMSIAREMAERRGIVVKDVLGAPPRG